MSDVALRVQAVLAQRSCVVGMGNPWRNDDGVGVHVARRLLDRGGLPPQVEVMSVEDVIESYAFDIAEKSAKNIVLVDAVVTSGASVGSVVFGPLAELEMATTELSTHKLALSTVASIFRQFGKETFLLGIVSANTDFGSEISAPVLAAAEEVIGLVRSARSN